MEELSAVGHAQVHFGVDGRLSWELNPHFTGRRAHRTEETGLSTGGEPLLRISAAARGARDGKRNVQAAIRTAGRAALHRWCGVWPCSALFRVGSSRVLLGKKLSVAHVSNSFGCVARSRLHNKPRGKSIMTMVSVDICCWRQAHWGWHRAPTDTKVLWTLAQKVSHPCVLTEGRVVRWSVLQSDIAYRKRTEGMTGAHALDAILASAAKGAQP